MELTPRAYSYLRFSTPEQMKGDSFRRQAAMALDYATKHGLELDRELTFQDLGVSAFRGKNAESGRLAIFLEAVRAGKVPSGSHLLVEQLDRLSRLTPLRALALLASIVDEGITVVTLMDGRVYTTESLERDQMSLLSAVITFIRANEESETKSRRVKQAWENKRAKMDTEALTARLPAWIEMVPGTRRLALNEKRAAVVRRIFTMTLEGVGQHKIAETLNGEGMKPWGRGRHWHRSYIAKMLKSPAAMGTFIPSTLEHDGSRAVRKPLAPIENYFPAAVEREVWDEVQTTNRAPLVRGRHANMPLTNAIGGLTTCETCGGTVTRVNKGSKSKPSLVCARAKAGAGCQYRSVPYELVEKAIRERLSVRLGDAPAGEQAGYLDDRLNDIDGELDALRDSIQATAADLARSYSPRLAQSLRDMEARLDELEGIRSMTLAERRAASGPMVASRIDRLREALVDGSEPEALNKALRQVFRRIVVSWDQGALELHWAHGGTIDLPFMWPRKV